MIIRMNLIFVQSRCGFLLRQRTGFIVNEHAEDTKQIRIKWHQAGVVGHQDRAGLFVESDVGWIGPGHRIW